MDLKEDIINYQRHISENIKRIMAEKEITQDELKSRCQDAGFSISQATISAAKNGKGNLTLSNLVAIAYALEVNVAELLEESVDCEKRGSSVSQQTVAVACKSDMLIHDPASIYLQGYMGDFHILFYKTSGRSEEMVRGILNIDKNTDGTRCTATLKLFTRGNKTGVGTVVEKVYEGELAVSHAMKASYVYLYNERDQELCMVIFQYLYTREAPIETAMAVAVTAASGANRRPTVHRICLSRSYVEGDVLEYVKGQLLMNTATIYITEEAINKLCADSSIPESFKLILAKVKNKKQCYCISEESLFDSNLSEEERYKMLSLVRYNSEAPKYNKISRGTDEALFSILHPV